MEYHPDLANRITAGWTADGTTIGTDYFGGGGENSFHGTETVGCWGAQGNGGGNLVGVAYNCDAYFFQIVGADGVACMLQAIDHSVANGVKIICISLTFAWSAFAPANRAFFINHVENNGIIFVFAAGNEGSDLSTTIIPIPGVLMIGGNDRFDNKYQNPVTSTLLSNYGTTIDFVSPSELVLLCEGAYYGYYDIYSGTSYGCPYAGGALALIWSANPALTNLEVIAIAKETVDIFEVEDVYTNGYWTPTTGTINAIRAVSKALSLIPANSLNIYLALSFGLKQNSGLTLYPATLEATMELGIDFRASMFAYSALEVTTVKLETLSGIVLYEGVQGVVDIHFTTPFSGLKFTAFTATDSYSETYDDVMSKAGLTYSFDNYHVTHNDPLFLDSKYLFQSKVTHAWKYSLGSPTQRIGYIDSGITYSAEFNSRIVQTWNAETQTDAPVGDYAFAGFHGTGVAGAMFAIAGNGVAGAGSSQGNPVVVSQDILEDSNLSILFAVTLAGLLDLSYDFNCKVISCSTIMHDADDTANIYTETVESLVANGSLLFACAGNDTWKLGLAGDSGMTPNALDRQPIVRAYRATGYPIIVGALDWHDEDTKAGFSNYGPDVRLVAPGYTTTVAPNGTTGEWRAGTSFATPFAAGCAALIWGAYPGLTLAQVTDILLTETTKSLDPTFYNYYSLDTGILNAAKGVLKALSLNPVTYGTIYPYISFHGAGHTIQDVNGTICSVLNGDIKAEFNAYCSDPINLIRVYVDTTMIYTGAATNGFPLIATWDGITKAVVTIEAWTDNGKRIAAYSDIMVTSLIPGEDTILPVIVSFTTPPTVTTLDIPILTFNVFEANTIIGYLVKEDSNPPLANDFRWVATAPENITIATAGSHTFWAWVKDDSNNISLAVSSTTSMLDVNKPYIDEFAVQAFTNTYTLGISTFKASDDIGAYGLRITTTTTPPPITGVWLPVLPAPTSTVKSSGVHTLYPWVKDAYGNVSTLYTEIIDGIEYYGYEANALGIGGVANPLAAIVSFSVPAQSLGLVVDVTFTGNAYTTGYIITERNIMPRSTDHRWSSNITSYTLKGYATTVLFGWVRNSQGFISGPVIQTVTPLEYVISHESGVFGNAITVTIEFMNALSTIYYTLNGTEPTINSQVYTGPLTFNKSTILKFYAVDEFDVPGSVHDMYYTIHGPSAITGPDESRFTVIGKDGVIYPLTVKTI